MGCGCGGNSGNKTKVKVRHGSSPVHRRIKNKVKRPPKKKIFM